MEGVLPSMMALAVTVSLVLVNGKGKQNNDNTINSPSLNNTLM